jgi:hypothetical protein
MNTRHKAIDHLLEVVLASLENAAVPTVAPTVIARGRNGTSTAKIEGPTKKLSATAYKVPMAVPIVPAHARFFSFGNFFRMRMISPAIGSVHNSSIMSPKISFMSPKIRPSLQKKLMRPNSCGEMSVKAATKSAVWWASLRDSCLKFS